MLSVIIPVFNTREYVERCLDSVLSQTLEEMEIIIVDDGSTDGSEHIVDRYAKRDSRVRVLHKTNRGLLAARLSGIENARGEYVGFVDSDDYIEPEMYEFLLEKIEESGVDVISSGIYRDYDTGHREIVVDHYEPGVYENLTRDVYRNMLYDFEAGDFGIYCNLVNKVFRRDLMYEVLEEIDKDITYGEDAAVFYSYMMKSKSAYITDASYYHYCIRKNSMCDSAGEVLAENAYRLYKSLYKAFEGSVSRDMLMQQLKRYMLLIERHRITKLYDIHPALLNAWEFQFEEKILDDSFAIYGAGGCGQAFYQHIIRMGKQGNLIAWIDRDFEHARAQCDYPVVSLEAGLEKSFKTVIIAVKSDELKLRIRETLTTEYNLSLDQISFLNAKELAPF